MRNLNLQARVERLEREVGSAAACYCCTVVCDDEEAPPLCPHGRPWSVVIRIVHEERGPVQP